MRSILVLLILVMIGLNGKGQSVTALPDSVLSQCCLEVTLLNGNVTTVDWVFIQYITRDGTGTKLFVEYAPNFGGIQWETQIRIQDDFDEVLERSKFIVIPFTVGSTDYGINRNWIANIEENTTTGGTWIYGRFGTPTKRKFSAVEDYETLKNLLLACRPRAIVVAENGLYTEGDTVRMGGFLIEPTTIDANNYDFTIIDSLINLKFELRYQSPDTTFTFSRLFGTGGNNVWSFGRGEVTNNIYYGLTSQITVYARNNNNNPTFQVIGTKDSLTSSFNVSDGAIGFISNNTNQDDISEFSMGPNGAVLRMTTNDLLIDDVALGVHHIVAEDRNYIAIETPNVDNGTARPGQFLSLVDSLSGEVEFATIDPVDSSLYATRYWTGQNFFPLQGGTLTGTGGAGFFGLPPQSSTPSTPASGFRMFANGAHNLGLRDRNGWITTFDISATTNRDFAYPPVGGTFALGTGTADRSGRWTDANILAAGNLFDNGARLQSLLPWQFHSWTTMGRPTGVDGYYGRNSSTGFLEGYYSSQWENLISSTGASTNQVPVFSSAGKISGSNNLTYSTNFSMLGNTNSTLSYQVTNSSSSNAAAAGMIAFGNNGKLSVFAQSGSGYSNNPVIGAQSGYIYADGSGGFALLSIAGPIRFATNGSTEAMRITPGGRIGIGDFSTSSVDWFLHVKNNINSPVSLISENTSSGTFANSSFGAKNNDGKNNVIGISSTGYTGVAGIGANQGYIYNEATNGFTFISIPSAPVKFTVGGTAASNERMRISADGKLGLGTKNPEFAVIRARDTTGIAAFSVIETATNFVSIAAGSTANPPSIIFQNNQEFRIATASNYYGIGFDAQWIFGTNGSFRMRRYGVGNMSSSSQSKTFGKIAAFANDGTILDATDNQIPNFYNNNDTIGTSRIATLTDSLRFRFGGSDLLRLKSNGALHVNMPTENNSFVITSSPSENYNNFRGNVYVSGTSSLGDTTTGIRRNNHDASYFSGINLIEGGDNVYYDAVAGYGNIVRGNVPKNIIFGVYNTITGNGDVGVYGYSNVVSGSNTTVVGRLNTVSASDAFVVGRSNTVTQNNAFVYGSVIGSTNATLHGFGTVTPRKRLDVNGDIIVGDTIYNTFPATHSTNDGFAVWKSTGLGYALGKATFGAGLSYSGGVLSATATAPTQILAESYNRITSTSSPQTFSSTISDNIVDQGSTQASFTFDFPAGPVDGQVLTVTWNNAISTLTLNGNGNTIVGTAVTTAVAGTQRKFKYCGTCTTPAWIKIY